MAIINVYSRLAGVLVAPNAFVLLKLNIFDVSAIDRKIDVS